LTGSLEPDIPDKPFKFTRFRIGPGVAPCGLPGRGDESGGATSTC